MTDFANATRRYLLGELAEAERAAFEARYFDDRRVFADAAAVENDLIDDYVRGRLADADRRRFEAVYLADPRRRERVAFAESLVTVTARRDNPQPARTVDGAPSRSGWAWLASPRPAFALAAVILLVVIGGGAWFAAESQRQRAALADAEAFGAEQARLERERQAQDEAQRARERDQQAAAAAPRATPSFVIFALAVGPGVRSAGAAAPATLTIPRGVTDVRLVLTVAEHQYVRYRAIVTPVGGTEVFRSGAFTAPRQRTASFTINVPATHFSSGDHMLTMQGAPARGEFDDLSQSLFRVVRQ